VNAVRAVHAGAAVLAPAIAPTVVAEVRRARGRYLRSALGESVQLTEREWHILEHLDRGDDTNAIATNLYVAPVTVRSHIAALMKKLGVRDRAAAVTLFRSGRTPR
jgi:DNA-binding NarL/FixJ family response regulator